MSWSRLRSSLDAGRLEGTALAEELALLLRRHTTSFPLVLADDSVTHDEGRALVARALEALATGAAAVADESSWQLREQVNALCMEPLFYAAPEAADALSRGLICGLCWLELSDPESEARDATRFVKAHVAEPPAWLSSRLAAQAQEPTWLTLRDRLDAFDPASEPPGELMALMTTLLLRGRGDDVSYEEWQALVRRGLATLVPLADVARERWPLEDLVDQCGYLVQDVVWNEDEPTTDPMMWTAMAAIARGEVVLGRTPDVLRYVTQYMPEPRPSWLPAAA
jgi:hypothetical protein